MVENKILIAPDARLIDCPERQICVAVAGPINERLDALVVLADLEGARTNRKELVAALVLAAEESPTDLAATVVAFRKARARDAAVRGSVAEVLEFRQHQPGPRPRGHSA